MRLPSSRRVCAVIAAACVALPPAVAQQPATPVGKVEGSAWVHTPESAKAAIAQAQVGLPARVTGGAPFVGRLSAVPATQPVRVPVVLFLHGSSGLGLAAIGQWQAWLAGLGIASLAPDSMALPGRLTYTSPIEVPTYERIHALRASEIALGRDALAALPWADPARLVLAGTSEGAVPVARDGGAWAGRMMFAWSCEDNYFVEAHRTATTAAPVLNVISSVDPFFSPSNAWLGNPKAIGHCGGALRAHPATTVVLVPGAPHTLLNLPQVRAATRGWLEDLLKP
ncbi:MAG: alpha/beta hydrolase [Burkholderiales bacterium]|jgi:poly(3-hydroxybutyrate) depolymerase